MGALGLRRHRCSPSWRY